MKEYQTILADPPWPYRGVAIVGVGHSQKKDGLTLSGNRKVKQIGVKQRYPILSIEQIKRLPIRFIVASNAHLYLWATNAFLYEANEVARYWGFEPKTVITWVKVQADGHTPSMRAGYYFRSASEHLLFCVRGSLRLMGSPKPTVFYSPRLPHSVKPEGLIDIIEESSPPPRLELFARRKRLGWDVWGNEVESDITLI